MAQKLFYYHTVTNPVIVRELEKSKTNIEFMNLNADQRKIYKILRENEAITENDLKDNEIDERRLQELLKIIREDQKKPLEERFFPFNVAPKKRGSGKWEVFDRHEPRAKEVDEILRERYDAQKRADALNYMADFQFSRHIISDFKMEEDIAYILKIILPAIEDKKLINIGYHSYKKQEPEEFKNIVPLFLKENRYGRFYLIAVTKNTDGKISSHEVKTLGLDRIKSVTASLESYAPNPAAHQKIKVFFKNLVGTSLPLASTQDFFNTDPIKVRVRATNFQAMYIQSNKIHESQGISEIEGDEKHKEISYNLIPNIEFLVQLALQNNLSNHDVREFGHPGETAIKVLEPVWMQKWVEHISERILRDHTFDPELEQQLTKKIENEVAEGVKFDFFG